jgi:cyclopropane fatty-acyl-phospholipid synthase-like methyltransferase
METYREHRKYFEEFYIDTPFFDAFTPERAATETDNLKKLCGFKKDDTILDTGCGHGRHCIRLKDDGFWFGLFPKIIKNSEN